MEKQVNSFDICTSTNFMNTVETNVVEVGVQGINVVITKFPDSDYIEIQLFDVAGEPVCSQRFNV